MTQSSKVCRSRVATLLLLLSALSARFPRLWAQSSAAMNPANSLTWSTDSTGPARFISVHGRRAAVFGYSKDGLEVWAYPFQILSSLTVSFRPQGTTTAIDGETILRGTVYNPETVTRVYSGPDFVVRESLFVPLDEPGAIIRYEVASSRPLDIVIRFVPVLDLMWPASIGGQEAVWNRAASAYLLSEPMHRFTGTVGSPNIVEHDNTWNQNRRLGRKPDLAFTIRANSDGSARIIISGSRAGQDVSEIAKKLLEQGDTLEKIAKDHYSELLNHVLTIETPDEATNRALAWAEVALDQAWVCNPDLGCGLVAGYGPSRNARRPQYDWFFAGDGMTDLPALLASGQYERAREELEFILRYQDRKTGMIWHELSQSAGWIAWSKYPYMFAHVELSFDFLNAMEDYFSATGDLEFVEKYWPAIQAAYGYCSSLINPKNDLPHIPAGKQGAREQELLTEELALSAGWITASQAFAHLAAATDHKSAASEADVITGQVAKAIPKRYWDANQKFWVTGYTLSGAPLSDHQIGPVWILAHGLFSDAERDSILQQLASSEYQTDWGARGRASSSSAYDPNSYADGSVWAVSTSTVAMAFWAAHHPATAFPIWRALVPWSSLDSLGHMHEALAGDYYHEELESVPEQTWSSAAFFNTAVEGLLGLRVDGISKRLTIAPHLPITWDSVTVRNLRVGFSALNFKVLASENEMRLQTHNDGASIKMIFDPEIPLGATLRSTHLQNQPIAATIEQHSQDTHARVEFDLPHGDALLTLDYAGGVAIEPDSSPTMIGEASQGIKITKVTLEGQLYTVDFDYLPFANSVLELHTPWQVQKVLGATFTPTSPGWYQLRVESPPQKESERVYQRGQVKLVFARGGSE